jgi:hypothetical protein
VDSGEAVDNPVVVVTAMPLSREARADLADMLGGGYVVVDIKVAPPTANILLTPVVSGQLLGSLRGLFPDARILFTELHDDGRGLRLSGPLTRIIEQGPDGYFVAHGLDSLAPIVQSEARLQLTGSRHRTPPRIGASTPTPAAPPTELAGSGPAVVWVRELAERPAPVGRWLDLGAVDALVTALEHTSAPRESMLWPAVAAECAVHLARTADDHVLVDVRALSPMIRAELQVRVASDLVDHLTWPQ